MTSSSDMIHRFGVLRRIEHHVFASTFILLTITGLAQRFHDATWSTMLVKLFGGIDNIRYFHRFLGVLCGLVLAEHIIISVYGLMKKGWQPAMFITRQDFTHAIHNIRFYFGAEPHPAACDRYDYKQKFEYWGVLLGGLIMVSTGLILWFPTFFFKYIPFFPGQIIPAAKVAHSNEAMLALLVIVIWHIYNAVFSPEVFPIDTAIFTGKISRERMRHEHPLELDRLIAEGKVTPDSHSTDDTH